MKALLLALSFTAGCSLLNQPDLSFLETDGSAGADADVDSNDSSVDQGDADGGADADAGTVDASEICDNELDDDDDRLVDCSDLDCADVTVCCRSAEAVLAQSIWDGGYDERLWHPVFDGGAPAPSVTVGLDFGPSGRGLLSDDGFDLNFGARIELEVDTRGSPDAELCPSLERCGDTVGVALSPVDTYTQGVAPPTSLSVDVTAGGEIVVGRGGRVLHRAVSEWSSGDRIIVAVDVVPSGQEGQRGFRVEVHSRIEMGEETVIWAPEELVLDERDNGPPGGMPGAYLALVGRTTNELLTTRRVELALRSCSNPAVFREAGDYLSAESLGLGDWAAGSFGSPTVARNASQLRILFEASVGDLGVEGIRPVPRVIGLADGTGDSFTASLSPILGQDTPSEDNASYRRPAMLPDDAGEAWISWDAGDGTGAQIVKAVRGAGWSLVTDEPPPLHVGDIGELQDIHSPAVARIDGEGGKPGEFHLWFVGVDGQGQTSLWHTTGTSEGYADHVRVLTEDDVGSGAAEGVQEPFVLYRDGVFHLWFFGQNSFGTRALYYAVAPPDGGSLELYEGNPVLDPNDPVLGDCPGGCSFYGGSAIDDGGQRLFFFGRSLGAGSRTYRIVQVAQQLGGQP